MSQVTIRAYVCKECGGVEKLPCYLIISGALAERPEFCPLTEDCNIIAKWKEVDLKGVPDE